MLFVALTSKLGLWQLRRGDEQARRDALQAQADLIGVRPWAGETGPDAWERKVSLKGMWNASGQILLDNRIHGEIPGYYVLTPLKLDDGRMVAVMRGWVPRAPNGLPHVEVPNGPVTVVVRLAQPEQRFLELSSDTVAENVWQNLDWRRYQGHIGPQLADVLAYQQDGNDALVRDWPRGGVSVERHYMYAGQWFLLAGLATVLFIVLHWNRKPS